MSKGTPMSDSLIIIGSVHTTFDQNAKPCANIVPFCFEYTTKHSIASVDFDRSSMTYRKFPIGYSLSTENPWYDKKRILRKGPKERKERGSTGFPNFASSKLLATIPPGQTQTFESKEWWVVHEVGRQQREARLMRALSFTVACRAIINGISMLYILFIFYSALFSEYLSVDTSSDGS